MRAVKATFLTLLLAAACVGCTKSEPPVMLASAYMDVVAAAFSVSACEAAGDIRQKTELISARAAIDGRISSRYGEAVLSDLKKKEAERLVATMVEPCPGDQGFRKYQETIAVLSRIVGED